MGSTCLNFRILTLKVPITTAADDVHKSGKIRLGISCESSARQRIHMKNQALFKSKKLKVPSAVIYLALYG